jgi:hypothetical protein
MGIVKRKGVGDRIELGINAGLGRDKVQPTPSGVVLQDLRDAYKAKEQHIHASANGS